MTWKKTKNKGKKRSTPKDVEDRKQGILHDKKEPKIPRKPTKEENRANKNCSRDTTAHLLNAKDVVNAYPTELERSEDLNLNASSTGIVLKRPDIDLPTKALS